ncbi:MAG: homoserine kinase [Dokdonella sp.]
MNRRTQATAFAPSSIGNVAVGFDILGQSFTGCGDRAVVQRVLKRGVRINAIRGCVTDLPLDPERNTAGRALLALCDEVQADFGFEVELEKGIPLGSGMGGSAASCVAALVAANSLLDAPMRVEDLYPFALEGETIASGTRHGDNVGPCLLGGLVLAANGRLLRINVPDAWHCAVVHPDAVLETRHAREALRGNYALTDFVAQSSNLALVLAGCWRSDVALVRAGLADVLIEPRRAPLIGGFDAVKRAALDHAAIGAGISGSGPSVFAWFEDRAAAKLAATAMCAAFEQAGFASQAFVSPVNGPAAQIVE